MTGKVQGQHLPAWVDAGKVVEYRLPDPAVERQTGQQHERRALVREAVEVGCHARDGDLR